MPMNLHKLGRMSLYTRVCTLAGIAPEPRTMGYFSRRQMMELMVYLERIQDILKRIEKLPMSTTTEQLKTIVMSQGGQPCSNGHQG